MTESRSHWRTSVMERLDALVALQPGWDGYTGIPVPAQTAQFALEVLDACCCSTDPMPGLVPSSSGGLQIEWHVARGDIELYIAAPYEVQAWYAEAPQGSEGEEVALTTDFTLVTRWLHQLTRTVG